MFLNKPCFVIKIDFKPKLLAPKISVCKVSPTIPILSKGMCLPDNSFSLFIASSKIGKGFPNQKEDECHLLLNVIHNMQVPY